MLETAIGVRYQHYRRAASLLILVTSALLFGLLWMANRQTGFFSQTYYLHGFLDNVRGIQKTTPVTLAGLKIGEVNALTITAYNRIRVDLALDRRYQPQIRGDSAAELRSDLLGNARIEINMGAADEPVLQDGQTIAFQRAPDLDLLIRQARQELAQAGAVLANLRVLTEELKKTDGGLLGTLDAVARMTGELSRRLSSHLERIDVILHNTAELSGQLGVLLEEMTQVSGVMSRSARSLAAVSARVEEGEGILGGLTLTDSPLSRHLLATAQKLDAAMTGLEKLTDRLPDYSRQTERILRNAERMTAYLAEASGQLPGLLDTSRRIAEDVDETVGALRRSPVLRAMNRTPPPSNLFDAPRDAPWPSDAPP